VGNVVLADGSAHTSSRAGVQEILHASDDDADGSFNNHFLKP
jgi:hypothetical protein